MTAFYEHFGYPCSPAEKRRLLAELVDSPLDTRLGFTDKDRLLLTKRLSRR